MINNKIILGTVQMGLPYGINNSTGKVPVDESYKILQKAYESGLRILDTAEAYGNAHQIIGDFHRANPDKIFSIITKIPPAESLIQIEDKIVNYLTALNINRLEGIMFHSFQSYKYHRKTLSELIKLKFNGFFKQLGVSVYTNDEFNELINDHEFDLVQLPFNLLDNFTVRGELIKKAKRKGKTIHTRSVFLQGLFFKSTQDNHPIVRALQHQLLKIREIAEEKKISITSLALNYCLQQSDIDNVIIGVDSVRQLKLNIEVSNYKLTEQLVQKINSIQIENKDLLNPSLWK